MPNKNDEFLRKLFATFKVEADEHLKAIYAGLSELAEMPGAAQQAKIIERIFREAHSLKGAARAVNMTQVESVCQAMESVFAVLKKGLLAVSPQLLDLLHEAIDDLDTLLSTEGASMDVAEQSAIAALIQRLADANISSPESGVMDHKTPVRDLIPEHALASATHPPPQAVSLSETVRVTTAKLGAVMRQAEELLPIKLASGQRAVDLREIAVTLAARKKQRAAIQPLLRSVERSFKKSGKGNGAATGQQGLAKLLAHLDAENIFIKSLEGQVAAVRKSDAHDHRALAGMVDGMLQDVREMLMLPFSSLLEMFPYFVRDLARDRGKEIELAIHGSAIEIDRRILEEMKDPFIHLLRNCIDHGIERPTARREKQKTAGGKITVAITQKDGGKIMISVADDGAGIDLEKVQASARKLGLIASGENVKPDEKELLALIFKSGVSTSPIITDISGRGLGLAIVLEKVERLGGTVEIETSPGVGTTFRMVMPLTLATFRGVLVQAAEQLFVLPLHNVECVVRADGKDIRTVENRETISLNGQAVALARLAEVLELPGNGSTGAADAKIQAAVLGLGVERIAFQVDAVLGEQEVLVKTLGQQLARVRNVAGACVLGTGQVVPVLNVADLMKSAVRQTTARHAPAAAKPAEMQQRSVLVVEDSITSRALLKNILESAGYRVTTAVDGLDAYTTLKTAAFDLVVSDVEMPRMDGFDLTAKIRADKQYSELPVVLVTALESREHRERGIDVGANAYIVKSSFDQSNLLEVVGRLV